MWNDDFRVIFSALNEVKAKYLVGGCEATVASISDLVDMKKKANRPKDVEDIRTLEQLA